MTREEFKKALSGRKTYDDVIAAVGRPDKTSDEGTGTIKRWEYRRRTLDTLSGKTDERVYVYFDQYKTYMNVEFP